MTAATAVGTFGVSRSLAEDLVTWYRTGLPAVVERQALKCLLNAIAAGVGGSRDVSAQALFEALRDANGPGGAPVLGRAERLGPAPSGMMNAFSVTQNDFDDAHFETILHPGAPALAGLVASRPEAPGIMGLRAFALGCEAQLAVASAISPSHYARGWHTSSTCAAIGSSVTHGLLLGLDEDGLAEAMDLALVDAVGFRESHGTETKGYQVGRATANGIAAAMAVFSGAAGTVPSVLGGSDGTFKGIADPVIGSVRVDGNRWHLRDVGLKPYPAGLVCFSAIEAALRAAEEIDYHQIESVRLEVSPLACELADRSDPTTESEARVSLQHCVAAALVEGAAGPDQFSIRAVEDIAITRVRREVELAPKLGMSNQSAILSIRTPSTTGTWSVDHPLGGPDRPLDEGALEDKLALLASGHLLPGPIISSVWALPDAKDLGDLFAAMCLSGSGR